MFSKIDKKVLVISIIVIIAILLVGFVVYQYIKEYSQNPSEVKNLTGGAQTEQAAGDISSDQDKNVPQIQIQAEGGTGLGSLTVCSDKCGDGICQKTDPACGKDTNLNCICPETPQECPKDCK